MCIKGKDAERILKEIKEGTPNTPKRVETIRRAEEVYRSTKPWRRDMEKPFKIIIKVADHALGFEVSHDSSWPEIATHLRWLIRTAIYQIQMERGEYYPSSASIEVEKALPTEEEMADIAEAKAEAEKEKEAKPATAVMAEERAKRDKRFPFEKAAEIMSELSESEWKAQCEGNFLERKEPTDET